MYSLLLLLFSQLALSQIEQGCVEIMKTIAKHAATNALARPQYL